MLFFLEKGSEYPQTKKLDPNIENVVATLLLATYVQAVMMRRELQKLFLQIEAYAYYCSETDRRQEQSRRESTEETRCDYARRDEPETVA